jgi:hypothetical protein
VGITILCTVFTDVHALNVHEVFKAETLLVASQAKDFPVAENFVKEC